MNDLQLQPSGPKSDWLQQARLIATTQSIGSPEEILSLLEWLKDMNWPGSAVIAKYVRELGSETIEPLRIALNSNDDVWTMWLLHELGKAGDREYWSRLQIELAAIASRPDLDGANIEALRLLAKHGLKSREWIKSLIETNRVASGLPESDFAVVIAELEA